MGTAKEYEPLRLLVDGEWLGLQGRATIPVTDPATSETIGELPLANSADIVRAIDSAARGYVVWRQMSAYERAKILRQAACLIRERAAGLATTLTLEQGKPLRESAAEIALAADTFDWCAEEGRRAYGRIIPPRRSGARMMVLQEPVGPVAAFAGWNAPAQTPARKIGSALAAGCSIIIKPSEETPATAINIARALLDAGLPKGVLNVVFGIPSEISNQLLASPVIRKVTFTGSTQVGKLIAADAMRSLKRVTVELGGHAPVLIFDDVDVEAISKSAVAAKYRNSGQICTSPTRFLVHEAVHDRFAESFAAVARSWRLGNGLDDATQMGPCANERRVDAVDTFVQDAVRHGGRLRAGGGRLQRPGFFFEPTLVTDVPGNAAVMSREPFGPIAVTSRFSTMEEAVEKANGTPFGLAAYVFTGSLPRAMALADEIQAGNVIFNNWVASTAETPFGGFKDSGLGSEGGIEGIQAFMVTKFVHHG